MSIILEECVMPDAVKKTCTGCPKELEIPPSIYKRLQAPFNKLPENLLNKEFGNFYVSHCGNIFCSLDCSVRYTED